MIRLLFRYLKQYSLSVLLVLGLLYFQAQADLELPKLMSSIVNTGITNKGVEDAALEAIRADRMDELLTLMSEKDQALVLSHYELLDQENTENLERYPVLKEQAVYRLADGNERAELSEVLAKPLLISYALDQGMLDSSQFPLPEGVDFYTALKMMPVAQKEIMLDRISENFSDMNESMLIQAASAAVLDEYQALGIDAERFQMDYIISVGLKMILFAVLSAVATIMVGFFSARMAAGTSKSMRRDVFKKVSSFSSVEFDQFSTASLMTRTGNDITQLQMLIVMMFRTFFYSPILAYGASMHVLNSNANMTWIIVLALVLILSMILLMFVVVMPKFSLIQKLLDKLNLVARESLTGLMVVRAFKTERHEEERFDIANRDLSEVSLFVNRAISFMMPLMNFIFSGVTLLIVWFGAKQIDIGALQIGDMMAFMQYAMQIIMSFMMIIMMFVMIPRASVSSKRILEVLDRIVSIKDPVSPHAFKAENTGIVEFKDVYFRYPYADDDVLKAISFTAKSGEMTAIIGSTGSGKSSLVNLIPRFYDVRQGEVKVNGTDVRELSQKNLRDRIGYVPQKALLFSGTIESNLLYAKEDATPEELAKAIEIAQAKNIVDEKALGMDEPISQGGSNVSGGQKQRLSIARALTKQPDIYIFDDSFSALDYKTDVALRSALEKDLSDKTLIVVAQRISTIMQADQILVLDEGEIVGRGSHDELMKNCEVYREIAFSQLSKEELGYAG